MYVCCDLETSTLQYSKNNSFLAVGYMGKPYNLFFFDFNTFIYNDWKQKRTYLYFHNLSFDGAFIYKWLLKNDFVYDERLKEKLSFKYLKTIANVILKLEIRVNNKYLIIKDLMRIAPSSIDNLGSILGFKKKCAILENFSGLLQKRDFASKMKFLEENKKLKEYLIRDVEIMEKWLEKVPFPLSNLTIASASLNEFLPYPVFVYRHCNKITRTQWNDFKSGYAGGLTIINPAYKNKHIKKDLYCYDINSSYPSVMLEKIPVALTDKKTPFTKTYYLFAFHYVKKTNDKMPDYFSYKKGFKTIYVKEEYFENVLIKGFWAEEWEWIQKCYFAEYQLLKTYHFKTAYVFNKFVKKYYYLKQNTQDPVLRTNYKLILNSCYGKLAQKNVMIRKILDKNGKEDFIMEDNKHIYPNWMASYITMKGRQKIYEAIQEIGIENWYYTDTDSIVCSVPLPDYMVDQKEIGMWKLEGVFNEFKSLKPKCYILYHNISKEKKSAISGLKKPIQQKLMIKDLYYGNKIKEANLKGYQVEDGVLLVPTDFVFKDE